MNKSAILHIPMSQYAYGVDEEHITIRIRTGKDDIQECFLFYGDRSCRITPVIFSKQRMTIVAKTELFDYFEVNLERPYKRLCYYFQLNDGVESILYYGDQFATQTVEDRSEYYQLPFNHRADIVRVPYWLQNTVIYNIFPDSFATDYRYISKKAVSKCFEENTVMGKLGGTLKGIRENADYLKQLGVGAIYINPIFAAGEYHKYDLIDYFHIDPCFGTNEEFDRLVQTYHSLGMKVIIDGVFNHCGWRFFAFDDVIKNQEKSEYRDWFYGLQFPVIRPKDPETYPDYDCFGYERMMPKLNTMNPKVRDYFCNVARYWVETFHIDGWRLDVASEVNDDFWRHLNQSVKSVNPNAVLIGEVWESAGHWLDGTIFDSAMNYDFRKHCKRFFAESSIDGLEFDSRVTDMRMRYRKQTVYAQLNVLDSHDVSRFLSLCNGDKNRYEAAVLFQMAFPGMPSVFYGDELGIIGMNESEYRQAMPWNMESSLLEFFQKVIALRNDLVSLREGDYRTIYAKRGDSLYVFERFTKEECVRIYINMNAYTVSLDSFHETNRSQNTPLYGSGYDNNCLAQYGFAVVRR